MAHFAKIDSDNIVLEVHVLNNDVLMKDGVENEQQGIEFLQDLFGNSDTYIQTSYNGNFRKRYAGSGFTYDTGRDAFIPPKPYPSMTLNGSTCTWEYPTAYPDDGERYDWDENTTSWVSSTSELE